VNLASSIAREDQSGAFMSHSEIMERVIGLGRFLLALPMVVYGVLHLIYVPFVASIVPPWIPWPVFWVYFTGITIIAAGISIVVGKQAHWAGTLLGTEVFLFVALIHVFLIFHRPGDPWAERSMFGDLPGRLNNAFKDLGLSGAAFIFAGAQVDSWQTSARNRVLALGRFLFAIPIAGFGVLHFLYPAFAPGVPPMYTTISFLIPGRLFWAGFTGAAFLVAAASIAIEKEMRLAAGLLGIMILVFALFTWVPRFSAHPSDIWGNWLKDLGLAGGALTLAGATPKKYGLHVSL
jgi:uncharacterized membrane protein